MINLYLKEDSKGELRGVNWKGKFIFSVLNTKKMVSVQFKSKTVEFSKSSYDILLLEVSKAFNLDVNRISLKNLDGKVLTSASFHTVRNDEIIFLKDFGPQISWKLVFLLEYLGPILLHSMGYYWYSPTQTRAKLFFIMNLMHYLKRLGETLCIHKFSHATMPLKNLFKNCTHYWFFGSVCLLGVYSPSYTPLVAVEGNALNSLVFAWCFCQVSNLKCHLILSNLRQDGGTQRSIPFGYMFSLVSCPNYFFEIIGWLIVSVVSGSLFTLFFTVLGKYNYVTIKE
jgi:very-long-chain enoyl-CoA reductase